MKKYSGLLASADSIDLSLSSVSKDEKPIAHMFYNKHAFSKYCKEYKEYWKWLKTEMRKGIQQKNAREELLKIRAGEFEYDELINKAQDKINKIE